MSRRFFTFTITCGLLAGLSAPLHAQGVGIHISVPFRFHMARHTYPAGEYVFWARTDHVIVQQAGGPTLAMLLTNRISGAPAGTKGRVVFECREHQCWLSQVWIPRSDDGRELMNVPPPSRSVRTMPGTYVALMAKP